MPDDDPFDSFRREAFRVERLPVYDVTDEAAAFESFKESGTLPSGFNHEWVGMLEEVRQRGGVVRRLRIVSDPPTEYELFELLAAFAPGIEVGEDIRVAIRGSDDRIPASDFWLYDQELLERLDYSRTGVFVGSRTMRVSADNEPALTAARKLFEEMPTVEQFRQQRELGWPPNQLD
ncbi:DUF6879 family protein [Arthrobacter sp. UYCu723]